jgi:hypothetical protein
VLKSLANTSISDSFAFWGVPELSKRCESLALGGRLDYDRSLTNPFVDKVKVAC